MEDVLDVTIKGLSFTEVERMESQGKVNIADVVRTKSVEKIIFGNIFTFFNLLFFAIAAWLIIVKAPFNKLLFLIIVVANLVIGIIQEIKAKKTLDELTLLNVPKSIVIREGKEYEIDSDKIVLNDVITLSTGNQIPADCVILKGNIEVNESMLTGESDLIKKKKDSDLFAASFVVSGTCRAKVTAVGKDTYVSKLQREVKKLDKPNSEILKGLNWLIRGIGIIIVPVAIASFMKYKGDLSIIDGLLNLKVVDATATGIVGMIPAGLYLMTSVSLAVGAMKLAKNHTLVRDLYCIETLARVNVLCLDKTGTITDGSMKVDNFFTVPGYDEKDCEKIIASMLNALNDKNMTSVAMLDYFGKKATHKPVEILPFSSQRKYSAVEFKEDTYILGAPEFVLQEVDKSTKIILTKFTKQGNRVLALAKSDGHISDDDVTGKRHLVAYIVISDNIRKEAPATLQFFIQNGVQIKVISGDNVDTVAEIAKLAGVPDANKCISLEGLSDKEVWDAATKYNVFGRVVPEQKRILVQALKDAGLQVGMTGDGVNDILALKEADCSIAMAEGSDAAKSVAQLVLMDSDFSNMPKIVGEGRRVINNIQKGASLFLMKTIYSVLIVLLTIVVGRLYPFQMNQMLIIETFVIGVPAFLLALETNFDVVHGGFVKSALRRAFPAALTITIHVIFIFALTKIDYFGGDPESPETILNLQSISTILILSTLFTGLYLLQRLCRPFNFYRGFIFIAMIVSCAASLIWLKDIFGIHSDILIHNPTRLLILLILVLSTSTVMKFISFSPKIIKNIVHEVTNYVDYKYARQTRNEEIENTLKEKTFKEEYTGLELE